MSSIAQLQKQLDAAEKRIKDVEAENERIRVDGEKKQKEMEKTIEGLTKENRKYLQESNKDHKNRVLDWKMGEEERKKMQEEWTKEKEELERDTALLMSEIDELNRKMRTMIPNAWLTPTHREYFGLLSDYITANTELKKQLKSAEWVNRDYVTDRKFRKKEFKTKMTAMEKEITDLKNTCWKWEVEMDRHKDKLKLTKKELHTAEMKLDEIDQRNQMWILENKSLLIENRELISENRQLKIKQQEAEKLTKQLEAEKLTMVPKTWLPVTNQECFDFVKDFTAKNAELTMQLKEAERKNKELVDDQEKRKKELGQVKTQKDALDKEISKLKPSFFQWHADLHKLESTKKELHSVKSKLGRILNENQVFKKKIKMLEEECINNSKELVNVMDRLRTSTHERMEKLLEGWRKKLNGVKDASAPGAYQQWSITFAKVVLECHGRFSIPWCKICGFEYSEKLVAKVLDCGHSVCMNCAEKLINRVFRPRIICPFDRTNTIMTDQKGMMLDLKTNFELMDALDVRFDGLKMIQKSFESLEQLST